MNNIIRNTVKEYSVQDFGEEKVDDDTISQSETSISPILLFELKFVNVRGNTIQLSANKSRKVEDHLSAMLEEIGNLETKVNKSDQPLPHILEDTQILKDRYEREVEKEDLERTNTVLLSET